MMIYESRWKGSKDEKVLPNNFSKYQECYATNSNLGIMHKTKLHLQKGYDFVRFDRRITSGPSEVTVTPERKASSLYIRLQDETSKLPRVF